NAAMPSEVTSALEDKVQNLDDKVTEVLDQVRSLAASQAQPRISTQRVSSTPISGPANDLLLPASNVARRAAELYLQF
ncbi:hypothetical protein NL519_39675, partial [Klebsiella pneumoniae]|nr:hypothetical protein [Klebsiella pneumoniae]